MTQQTEKTYVAEFLKWTVNRDFCLEVVALKAATADEIYVGSLLRDNTGYIVVANGSESSATHISLERITAAGGEKILTLARGPALIDPNKLNFEASVTWAEVAAYYAARDIRPAPAAMLTAGFTTQTY